MAKDTRDASNTDRDAHGRPLPTGTTANRPSDGVRHNPRT